MVVVVVVGGTVVVVGRAVVVVLVVVVGADVGDMRRIPRSKGPGRSNPDGYGRWPGCCMSPG